MKKNYFVVKSVAQAALFEYCLKGQISDGYWENSRPFNHWQMWGQATVQVAKPGDQTGRNFYPLKDNYNFAAKGLLDVVGNQMLATARLGIKFGMDNLSLLRNCIGGNGEFCVPSYPGTHYEDIRARLAKFDPKEVENAINGVSVDYTMKDMKDDLQELKSLARTRIA